MNKKIKVLSMAASMLAGSAMAVELKPISDSVFSADGLPEDGYTSASIVAYGEPPAPEPEKERRFEVGFVPTVPAAPNAEQEEAKADTAMPEGMEEPMKADAGEDGQKQASAADEMKGSVSDEKTSAVTEGGVTKESDAENMGLRLE